MLKLLLTTSRPLDRSFDTACKPEDTLESDSLSMDSDWMSNSCCMLSFAFASTDESEESVKSVASNFDDVAESAVAKLISIVELTSE